MRAGRWVFDTNALVSRLLVPSSVPALALQKGVETGYLLVSEETLLELIEVLSRPKFDKYLDSTERQQFLDLLGRVAVQVDILQPIKACRDPKDDKFLSLAINGRAHALVSGDADLLELNPFMGIPIVSPAVFVSTATDFFVS